MDMRTKPYPGLPTIFPLRLVLPRSGDLRYRSQVPATFAQGFFVHAEPRHRDWYARFQVQRKFIVMSTQGDLYTKSTRMDLRMDDLPRRTVLAMPRVAPRDLVKVLDLVECTGANGQRWELVRVRWLNKMETWLTADVVQLSAPQLMQEFYVNSINSWAFHDRVQPGNLSLFRTEVELWLFHAEFQAFYVRLRQQRATTQTPQQQRQDTQQPTRVRVKPETTAPTSAATPYNGSSDGNTSLSHAPARQTYPMPIAPAGGVSNAAIAAFEQRRVAREQWEQMELLQRRVRGEQAQMARQQEADRQQQRLHEQQQAQVSLQRQVYIEQGQRRQHELHRQRVQQELHQKQLEYQRRLEAQKEQERRAEHQRQELQKEQWIRSQRELRERLSQEQQQHRKQRELRYQLQSSAESDRPARRLLCVEDPERPQKQRRRLQQERAAEQDQPERQEDTTTSIWAKSVDDDYTPPESEEEESEASGGDNGSGDSDGSDEVVRASSRARRRSRKRLLYSQIEDDDDEDLPGLSEPASNTRQRSSEEGADGDSAAFKPVTGSKKRKRIWTLEETETTANSVEAEIDLTQLSDGDEDNGGPQATASVDEENDGPQTTVSVDKVKKDSNDAEANTNELPVEAEEEEEEEEDAGVAALAFMGEIRCACEATSVGKYGGQWLQCWKEDCGVWEHADCVGFLTKNEQGEKSQPLVNYVCSKCDPTAYLQRTSKASNRILYWLFQCCDSHNSNQLMELLRDNCGADKLPADWKHSKMGNRTLAMHVARRGLVKCLRYLLCERKVDAFATDKQSRNVLHHAAQGGYPGCCRLLLKLEPKLLQHQDLRGCTPFHRMLQSIKVNKFCVPYLRKDPALVGMGDLDGNLPIHFACQAINESTVEICRLIFDAQPSMVWEKSSQHTYPVVILCRAAGSTNAEQVETGYLSKLVKWTKQIVTMILDIDVFAFCLNDKSKTGWMALHHAVDAGNHDLVDYLCSLQLFDIHAPLKKTNETALHIAARRNYPLCVRTLLYHGLNVVAKDANERIPILYAKNSACIQEFLHYKLTKQLSRLHRMLNKFHEREVVRQWQRKVVLDPTCFDIINDWCQESTERIERMEGLMLTNPFMLRLDNKIEYIVAYVIPSLKTETDRTSLDDQKSDADSESNKDTESTARAKKKLGFAFSREYGAYWKQFVAMARGLEPEDFRSSLAFANDRGGETRAANMKLVLIRLAADLRKEEPGLLLSSTGMESEKQAPPSLNGATPLEEKLLGFYVLGELVAHFVLFAVPVNGILDFAPAFLRCVTCDGKYRLAADEPWAVVGRCFAAGFKAVMPATLELLLADDLRVLLNGAEPSLNALQIHWDTAVNWPDPTTEGAAAATEGEERKEGARVWMPRLMRELVVEEQQLLLLFLAGTFQSANQRLFRADEASDRLTIAPCSMSDGVVDYDTILPVMEHTSGTLHLPLYSCYEAFKKAMLTAIRHLDRAFLPS